MSTDDMQVVDLVAALRASVEAAKARREATQNFTRCIQCGWPMNHGKCGQCGRIDFGHECDECSYDLDDPAE